MSEIISSISLVVYNAEFAISSGERIVVQVLNADGSVKSTQFDVQVPDGKNIPATHVNISGQLHDNV